MHDVVLDTCALMLEMNFVVTVLLRLGSNGVGISEGGTV